MRITSVSNVNFRSVTPIITKKGDFEKLQTLVDVLSPNDHYCCVNSTDLYKRHPSYGLLTNAVNNDKEVGFLITGKEYVKYSHFEVGFASETGPTRHIDKDVVEFKNDIDFDNKDTFDKFTMLMDRIEDEGSKLE